MATTIKILSGYPCMHPAERLACRSMARAYNDGINRRFSVIVTIFQDNLPAAQAKSRQNAWEAQYRMETTLENQGGVPTIVYPPNRPWCRQLGEAFLDGSMPQHPPLCYRLAFLNVP